MKAKKTEERAAAKEKAKPERDAKGRFVKGNKGGPGNPFARQLGVLRATMMYCVPPERMARVVVALTDKAASGDVAAMRLFFLYLIGKPAEAVNPDRLSIDEWQKIRDGAVDPQEIGDVLDRCPVTAASDMVKEYWAAAAERNFQEALKENAEIEAQVAEDERYMEEMEKAEEEERRQAESAQPASQPPSPNGPTAEESSSQTSKEPQRVNRPVARPAKSEPAPSPNRVSDTENRSPWRRFIECAARAEGEADSELEDCIRELIRPSPNGRRTDSEFADCIRELIRPSPNGRRTEPEHTET